MTGVNRAAVVYRLWSETGELLYVGVAYRDAKFRRLAQHEKSKPWWPEVAAEEFQAFETRDSAEAAETAAIRTEHPRYNVHGSREPRHRASTPAATPAAGPPRLTRAADVGLDHALAFVETLTRDASAFTLRPALYAAYEDTTTTPLPRARFYDIVAHRFGAPRRRRGLTGFVGVRA